MNITANEITSACSYCGRVKLNGEWQTVSDEHLDSLLLSHGICEACDVAEVYLKPINGNKC